MAMLWGPELLHGYGYIATKTKWTISLRRSVGVEPAADLLFDIRLPRAGEEYKTRKTEVDKPKARVLLPLSCSVACPRLVYSPTSHQPKFT